MPYIPHTKEEEILMLARIGADSIEDLLVTIPENVRLNRALDRWPNDGRRKRRCPHRAPDSRK